MDRVESRIAYRSVWAAILDAEIAAGQYECAL
jgi:hypothetical protein